MRQAIPWIARAGPFAAILAALLLAAPAARGHCDGMDGPVVAAARKALAAGDVTYALVWVQKADDGEVRQAFERTMAVRTLGPEAKDLADHYFFETLVRIHRAGEGAPYTGLKPAGRDLGPAIPAADRALDSGSVEPVEKLLTDAVASGVRKRFREAADAKSHAAHDVEAGRRYVRAYVAFIHYVERLYEAARTQPQGHFAEAGHEPAGAHAGEHASDASVPKTPR
jgi:hypothetical protein